MLHGLAAAEGASVDQSGPIPDEEDRLLDAFRQVLAKRPDVLIVTGGVSVGPRDLVPSTLATLGVEAVFHKVRIKPGKPIWFGVLRRPDVNGSSTLVFGLPGNPVSSLVGFLLFVRPALQALMRQAQEAQHAAPLAREVQNHGDRLVLWPVRIEQGRAVPLAWGGSSNLRALTEVDGFVQLDPSAGTYSVGDVRPYVPISPVGMHGR
jgi:molybdopterin molybdotransferase